MASKLTNYRIFIASPGGLEQEREAFRDTVLAYNDSEAIPRTAYFSPIGWEITLRGVGRAQEKINEEVRKCDYFVLLLWDRWGTPTGSEKNHSSGTEEEYAVAWECYDAPKRPMREIIVLFKAVDPRHLSDPGPQLQKVLEFKKSLEIEKKLFFDTFDDLASFNEKLRRYLAQWIRDHEKGDTTKVFQRPVVGKTESSTDHYLKALEERLALEDGDESDFVKEAEQLLKQGKLTEAEAKLVQAIVPGDDLNAFRVYGQFLINSNRLRDAESVFKRMLKLARDSENPSWIGFALAKLGGVYRFRNQLERSEQALKEALLFKKKAGDSLGIAYVSAWLGDLYLQWKKWKQAEEAFLACLKVRDARKDEVFTPDAKRKEEKFVADTKAKLSRCAFQQKNLGLALELVVEADKIYEKLGEKKSRKKLKPLKDSIVAQQRKAEKKPQPKTQTIVNVQPDREESEQSPSSLGAEPG
jgi:tetratricopeptide (TPR) repeat protein